MHRDLAVRSLALAVATVAVGGCQVFQPYVMPRHYAESAPQGKLCNDPSRYPVEAPPSGTTQGTQLGPEIAFARSVQGQLSCFARQHSEFAAAMGYGLIPLAALVSYKSFAGANPHHLAALAAGGAAGYGIARYQYRPRDLVYLMGVTAVDCAVQVAQPSILTPKQRTSVETRQDELAKAAESLDRADRALSEAAPGLDEAHRLIAGTGERERKAANAIVAELRSLAATAHDDVATLRERAGTASSQVASLLEYDFVARKDLVNTVEGIVHAVNMQIATQQPDAAVLASLVTPLKMPVAQAAQSNGGAATGPEKADAIKQALNGLPSATYNVRVYARNKSGAETAEREDSREKLLGLADKLADALHDVQSARRTIESIEAHLAALSTPTNLARLHKQCSIEVTAATALTVSLPKEGVSVPNGGAAISVPVVGGSKPYSATVVDAAAKGTLSADLKVGTGDAYTLALSAKDFAAPQKLRVMVQDAHGQAIEIAVQVLTK